MSGQAGRRRRGATSPIPVSVCLRTPGTGPGASLLRRLRILGAWKTAAGAFLASRSRAVSYDAARRSLTVEVSSERWAQELREHEKTLAARLTDNSGDPIERLEIVLERGGERS